MMEVLHLYNKFSKHENTIHFSIFTFSVIKNKTIAMEINKEQNKLNELTVKQNLLLWQLSKSFLDLEKKIMKTFKHEDI